MRRRVITYIIQTGSKLREELPYFVPLLFFTAVQDYGQSVSRSNYFWLKSQMMYDNTIILCLLFFSLIYLAFAEQILLERHQCAKMLSAKFCKLMFH